MESMNLYEAHEAQIKRLNEAEVKSYTCIADDYSTEELTFFTCTRIKP